MDVVNREIMAEIRQN